MTIALTATCAAKAAAERGERPPPGLKLARLIAIGLGLDWGADLQPESRRELIIIGDATQRALAVGQLAPFKAPSVRHLVRDPQRISVPGLARLIAVGIDLDWDRDLGPDSQAEIRAVAKMIKAAVGGGLEPSA